MEVFMGSRRNITLACMSIMLLFLLCCCTEEVQKCASFDYHAKEIYSPSVVKVYFGLHECEGPPLSGLNAGDFKVSEDGREVLAAQSSMTLVQEPSKLRRSTLVLVDMSGGLSDGLNLQYVQRSLLDFTRRLASTQETGIYAFDGREELQKIIGFTSDTQKLDKAINDLDKFKVKDKSSNLNGAVILGLKMLDSMQKPMVNGIFTGSLLIVTDGIDHAGYAPESRAVSDSQFSDHAIFTIGIGEGINPDYLEAVGKDGAYILSGAEEAGRNFADIAGKILETGNSYYILAYCSLSRAGSHKLSIEVRGYGGRMELDFNANKFTGGNCGTKDFKMGGTDADADTDTDIDTDTDTDSDSDEAISPMSVGNRWTFEVTGFTADPTCSAGTYDSEVIDMEEIDGSVAYEKRTFCSRNGNQSTSYFRVDGDNVEVLVNSEWETLLDPPVQDGHEWTSYTGSARHWEERGQVTVPAGTFDDCWAAVSESGDYYVTYCRGTGPVKSALENDYEAVLTDYELH